MYRYLSERSYFWEKSSIKVFIAIALGIFSSTYFPFTFSIFGGTIGLFMLIFFWKKSLFNSFILSSSCLLILFFGIQIRLFLQTNLDPEHYTKKQTILQMAKVLVSTVPKIKDHHISFWADLVYLFDEKKAEKTSGKIAISLNSTKDSSELLEIGDFLYFPFQPQDLPQKSDLSTFDYGQYLRDQQVFQQQNIKDRFYIQKEANPKFFHQIQRFQQKLTHILANYISNKESFAILSALILGEKRFLDSDIQDAFANTGAIHVLAVSGLHVGIVKLLIDYLCVNLFVFLRKKKLSTKQKGTIQWFTLGLIWGYALLTGGSDSVLRSACMLSIWRLFGAFKLPLFSIDAVFISAIILLTYDPTMLFHVGFQLSYAAVLGILILYPPIYNWLVFKRNKTTFLALKKYLWGMTSVGIAAQIGVLPLSFFYFKKVAVLFWLVNPIVLTCASFLLPAGLLLLFLHSIYFWTAAQYLGWGISKITEAMFWFLQKVETLSFLNIQINLNNLISVILLYLIFYLIFLSFSYKIFFLKVAVFIASILICCLQIFQQYNLKPHLVLANTKDNMIFIFSNAWEKHIVFTKKFQQQKDSVYWMDQIAQYRGIHQTIKTYTLPEKNQELKNDYIFYREGLLIIFGHKIFIVPEYFEKLIFQKNTLDYVIFPHSKNLHIENLNAHFQAKRKFICRKNNNHEISASWENLYYNTVQLE